MKIKILLGVAALVATATAATVPIHSVPASAATPVGHASAASAAPPGLPLPVGVFGIQSFEHLECADTAPDSTGSHTVYMDPCELLNLNEQFTYDPLTLQILSVGQVGYCLGATVGLSLQILWEPCDATNLSQKFQQTGPDSSGWTMIFTSVSGQAAYLLGDSVILRWTPSLFQEGTHPLFRFLP